MSNCIFNNQTGEKFLQVTTWVASATRVQKPWLSETQCQSCKNQTVRKRNVEKAVLRLMSAAGSQTDKTFLKASVVVVVVVVTFFLITRRLRSLSSWGWIQGWISAGK